MRILQLSMQRATLFAGTYEKREGLYQNKVNSSLSSPRRPDHQTHNLKMGNLKTNG